MPPFAPERGTLVRSGGNSDARFERVGSAKQAFFVRIVGTGAYGASSRCRTAEEVPYILAHEKELSLVKSLLSPLAKQINPHLKAVNDAFWLGLDACKLYYNYEAWKLHYESNQPNRNVDALTLTFDLADFVLEFASLVGDVLCPSLKLDDHCVKLALKYSKSVARGEPLEPDELLAAVSGEQLFSIPRNIVECAGLKLKPDSQQLLSTVLSESTRSMDHDLLDNLRKERGLTGPPIVAVPPGQVPSFPAMMKGLSLTKPLASLAADENSPDLKKAIDSLWISSEAYKLHCKLNQPNRNVNARFSDLAGHGLDVASVLARTRA